MPDWTRDVRDRLSSLRLEPARESEIVEELSQHLEERFRELTSGGTPPDAATALTLAEFRDRDLLARHLAPLRQARVPAPITPGSPPRHLWGDLVQDLRYALRTVAARPGFSAVAILSLALGIGANTAIFSLWKGVLHAPLPGVKQPEGLVILSDPSQRGSWTGSMDGPRWWLSYGEFEDLRDHADSFSALMASQSSLSTLQVRFAGGDWEEASGRLVSGGFFELLGVSPAIGRLFTAGQDRVETTGAVVSHSYWQRRFAGSPDALGKSFTVGKAVLTIVGIAPASFAGETSGQRPDFWLPLRLQPSILPGRDRLHDTPPNKAMWLHVFGRLKPGVTLAQADAQANAIFHAGLRSFYGAAVSEEGGKKLLDQRLTLRPAKGGASVMRKAFAQSLTALLAAVGVLLLIACANLASLLLARGAARRPEIALRLSLGASRGRLIRQLVTESLALAALGGVAAVAVATLLHGALVRMVAQSDQSFEMRFDLDPLLLGFVTAVTIAAALLSGALPAWQATKADAGAALKEQSRSGSLGSLRSGRSLVSLQLALSLPLLVGAGLLARTVWNLQRMDLGYPAARLTLLRLDLRETPDGAPRESRLREVLEEIQRIPGVRAVSYSQLGVFSGGESSGSIEVEGFTATRQEDRESGVDAVGSRYFSALGVPILLGRELEETDRPEAAKVCVINEAFAKRFFDGRNPIGMRITALDDDRKRIGHVVVGVARNARTKDLRGEVGPRYFVLAAQRPSVPSSPIVLIRGSERSIAAEAARKAVQRVDAALPILSTRSIEEQLAPQTAQDRTTAQIAVVFGSAALLLAAIGLYGLLSYGVARRTGEIAVRIALGAPSGSVVSMILRETTGLVSVGLLLGAGLAYAASRLVDSRLYGVAPQDPVTLAFAAGLLLLVALGAAYLPARRASRVDPMAALRQW